MESIRKVLLVATIFCSSDLILPFTRPFMAQANLMPQVAKVPICNIWNNLDPCKKTHEYCKINDTLLVPPKVAVPLVLPICMDWTGEEILTDHVSGGAYCKKTDASFVQPACLFGSGDALFDMITGIAGTCRNTSENIIWAFKLFNTYSFTEFVISCIMYMMQQYRTPIVSVSSILLACMQFGGYKFHGLLSPKPFYHIIGNAITSWICTLFKARTFKNKTRAGDGVDTVFSHMFSFVFNVGCGGMMNPVTKKVSIWKAIAEPETWMVCIICMMVVVNVVCLMWYKAFLLNRKERWNKYARADRIASDVMRYELRDARLVNAKLELHVRFLANAGR